jgi:hypothetical protein
MQAMRTVSTASSSAALIRRRCGGRANLRTAVPAPAALVLCICVAALSVGDPDLALCVIGIWHNLVLGLVAVARAVCARIAPRRLSDTVLFMLLYLTLSFRTADGTTLRRGLQGAQMAGGRPPRAVEAELCTIVDVFSKLTGIKTNLDCQAGCAAGTGACPADWYPSAADECSAACGEVFEPFVSTARALRLLVPLHLPRLLDLGE